MPSFRITGLDVFASYNQINSAFAMRPTPQYISIKLFEQIAPLVDVEAAFAQIRQNNYEAANAKAAAPLAQVDLIAALNQQAQGIQIGLDAAVYYRKTSGGTHETVWYVTKSEGGGAFQPWAFTLGLDGQTIDGYVSLTMAIAEGAAEAMRVIKNAQKPAASTPKHAHA